MIGRSVDRDRAYDAHEAMKRSIGDALRGAASAPAAAPAWGGGSSFGGAPVSDRDAAEDAYEADAGSTSGTRGGAPMSATDLDSRIAGVLSRAKALPDDVAALLV